jgi:hypothetical protein
MKFEVVEKAGAWIVLRDGVELARYAKQASAMTDVSERLGRLAPSAGAVSLTMRYETRGDA